MKKYFVTYFIICISFIQAFASFSGDPIADTTKSIKDTVYFTYYGSLNYSNNLIFFGRSGIEKSPFVSTDLYMQIPAGFWTDISFLSFYQLHSITQIDNIVISVGYDKKLNKKFGISTSYNKYFYPSNDVNIQTASSNLVDFYLGYKTPFVKSSLGGSYMIGEVNDIFSSFTISGYLEKLSLFKTPFDILFEPRVSVNSGTQNFVSIYQDKKAIVKGQSKQTAGKSSGGNSKNSVTNIKEINKNNFNILSYEFALPITISYNRFSIQATYSYIIPVNLLIGDNSLPRSIFSSSLSYTIFKEKIRYKPSKF